MVEKAVRTRAGLGRPDIRTEHNADQPVHFVNNGEDNTAYCHENVADYRIGAQITNSAEACTCRNCKQAAINHAVQYPNPLADYLKGQCMAGSGLTMPCSVEGCLYGLGQTPCTRNRDMTPASVLRSISRK